MAWVRRGAALDPLRLGEIEAVLANLAAAITVPFVVPYAVALGATPWQVGLITALPPLVANASQVPAARWGALLGHRWPYLVLVGVPGRAVWLALALLLLTGRASFPILFGVVVIANLSTAFLTPLWTAFLGRQVPEGRRGRYFGWRNLLAGAAGLLGAFLAATFASALGFVQGSGIALALAALAASAALAAQVVALASSTGGRPESPRVPRGADPRDWRTPAVRRYVLYGALLVMGAGMATPFYPVHFIKGLGGSPEVATTAVAVASAMVFLGQGLWGRLIDQRGLAVVGAGSLAGIAAVPLLWLSARGPELGVAIWLFNGLMWSACGLATFNLMLSVSTDANRASVVAWVSALQSPVQFAAPMIGGLLAERTGMPGPFVVAAILLTAAWAYFVRRFWRAPKAPGG